MKKNLEKISSGKKSHNRVPPQQFACDWIRSKKFLTIGYQDTNRMQTLNSFMVVGQNLLYITIWLEEKKHSIDQLWFRVPSGYQGFDDGWFMIIVLSYGS